MMKLYDFDGMFDKKMGEFISQNKGKYTEEEWEDVIPKLYKKFGDTFIASVGNSPSGYYSALGDNEIVFALRTYLKKDLPVCGFLSNEIERRGAKKLLFPLLDGSAAEREYAVRAIGDDDAAIKKYMQLLCAPETDEELKNTLVDIVKGRAESVACVAVENYQKGFERGRMLEIMSESATHDERIFKILIDEFLADNGDLAVKAGYLAAYGDVRALEYLLAKIDDEGISYLEYKELLLAIEALGGSYTKKRDFSADPYYNVIKNDGKV